MRCAMRTKRLQKECLYCGGVFEIPPCREWREKCCSSECKKAHREKLQAIAKEARKRVCAICGNEFIPRQWQIDTGAGKLCSKECQMKHMIIAAHKPESNKKRTISFMKSMDGKYRKGADHHQWTGGVKAALARTDKKRKENPEKYRAMRREYIAANPDRAREWSSNRQRRKYGRLPRGTVKAIGEAQRWKCAVCKCKLGDDYHVDHIYPLAKGGLHVKENIQILCAPCNVRKSAKDPIKFMQEKGFLL
jgi:5-methylcytosine-specific restriction endonuclease McrA